MDFPHKIVDGEAVPLTAEEIAEIEQRDALAASQAVRDAILAQIAALEATVTNERLRAANLTEEGRAWLADVDAEIAALRVQL